MNEQQHPSLNVIIAFLMACFGGVVAGSASQALAQIGMANGGPSFIREPINAVLALFILFMWQRWRPAARAGAPKWGHVGIGLITGLGLGIALPALALTLMSVANVAKIHAPQVSLIALGVPFIFLIFHGLAEEMLVRGIAQREAHHHFGALAGVVTGAVCFGSLQALQGYVGFWEIINGTLFGACLGFLALGPGGIWAASGAHAGWTWLEIAVLGQRGQIVKTSNWFAGSGADSYGAPAFTLVLLAVLALQMTLHLRGHKRTV
jgi:membrane protease YdiL (CAAX protease family)